MSEPLHRVPAPGGGGPVPWARTGFLTFAALALTRILSPAAYRGAALEVIRKQIYFTAWQIVPGFALFVALLTVVITVIVGATARDFGLYAHALELVVRLLALELLPLLTALFVGLRTGAAMNTEVALMQINNELEALELVGVDPVEFEFMPRIVGGTLAVVALTAVGIVIALALVYLVIEGIQPWSLPPGDFGNVLGKVFGIPALLVLWLKAIAFGLAVTVIPITAGVATPKRLAFAPISVLRGMVRLFVAIMLIEGLTLVAGRVV